MLKAIQKPMVRKNLKAILVRLPDDEMRAIRRAAELVRLSVTDYVRLGMRERTAADMAQFGERPGFLPEEKR
jgi:uncharacterized protein (DUF1778 family)